MKLRYFWAMFTSIFLIRGMNYFPYNSTQIASLFTCPVLIGLLHSPFVVLLERPYRSFRVLIFSCNFMHVKASFTRPLLFH